MLIQLHDIKKTYKTKNIVHNVLNGVNLIAKKGELLCVRGSSGVGKSTLLNIISGIQSATSGKYYYMGEEVNIYNNKDRERLRREKVGIIRQRFALIEDFNIFDNIALPLKYQKVKRAEIKQRVFEILEAFGIEELSKKYPDELSGGEQQRICIARAIIKKPMIIVADEPTASLDESNTDKVLKILKALGKEGVIVVIASHEAYVANQCHTVLTLRDGKLINEQKKDN